MSDTTTEPNETIVKEIENKPPNIRDDLVTNNIFNNYFR